MQCTISGMHRPSCPEAGGNLPGPGIEPVSPALAGGFGTTEPPREVPDEQFFFLITTNQIPSS